MSPATQFRVKAYKPGTDELVSDVQQAARSAEEAARLVLGEDLSRGNGMSRGRLRAKVYSFGTDGVLTMVRLYLGREA